MSEYGSFGDGFKRALLLVGTLLLLLSLLGVFGSLIARALHPPQIEQRPFQRGSYETALRVESRGELLLWVELGRDGQLLSWRRGEEAFEVEVREMEIGNHWQVAAEDSDQVNWHLRSAEAGELRIRPIDAKRHGLRQAKAIALYLCDDRWSYRSSLIHAGKLDRLVDSMYPGKWVVLPIDGIEPMFEEIRLSIKPLLGYGTLVSAVAVLGQGE